MSCTKMRFPSRWHALRALALLQARGRPEIAVYPCRCGSWHLTSKRAAIDWGRRAGWL